MEKRLTETIKLKNGLSLEIYDSSRPVVGDRWLVSLIAHIGIEVKPEYFRGEYAANIPFHVIRETVGKETAFNYEKKKNFVPGTEKDDVFQGLKQRFLDASVEYLSTPDFPRKLILKQYQEAKGSSQRWVHQ